MNPARHHTLNQTAHILDSTSHTQMYRPASPLSSSTHRASGPATNQRPSHSHLSHTSPSKQSTSTSRPKRSQNLHIPGLPRYHPANFLAPSHPALAGLSPSSNPSPLSTSSTSEPPSNGPTSTTPRQRYADAQRLRTYQRDILEQLHRNSTGGLPLTSPRSSRPTSPQLEPLMSPGDVVTPLELAGQEADGDGYLMARPEVRQKAREVGARESLEELIGREEGRSP